MARLGRRRLLLLLAGLGLGYTAAGGISSYSIEVTRVELGLGIRVALVADLHVHRRPRRDVAELVEELDPDLVLVLGDLVDRLTPSLAPARETLRQLARTGGLLYGVPGNHEHSVSKRYGGGLRWLRRLYREAGGRLLADEAVGLPRGTLLLGLDWKNNPNDYWEPLTRLLHRGPSPARLLVAVHSPDAGPHAAQLIEEGRAVVVAGHTHGGQICLPGATSMATNSVYGFHWGLYRLSSNVAMYVSRGLGEMLPPRLYCPYQLILLT